MMIVPVDDTLRKRWFQFADDAFDQAARLIATTWPNPLRWRWNFGDQMTSTLQGQVHAYAQVMTRRIG